MCTLLLLTHLLPLVIQHDHDITAPMKMYNGAVEIAQGAGVGVLPVTLRYNLPVGLDKMDCPLSNATQVQL
jgi:hypothetical protein